MNEDNETFLQRYKNAKASGDQPIYMFKNTDDIDAWSNISPQMLAILIELEMLSTECNTPFIHDNMVIPTLRMSLSVQGYARGQVEKAHTGLYDDIKHILSGMAGQENATNKFETRK